MAEGGTDFKMCVRKEDVFAILFFSRIKKATLLGVVEGGAKKRSSKAAKGKKPVGTSKNEEAPVVHYLKKDRVCLFGMDVTTYVYVHPVSGMGSGDNHASPRIIRRGLPHDHPAQ